MYTLESKNEKQSRVKQEARGERKSWTQKNQWGILEAYIIIIIIRVSPTDSRQERGD